MTTGWAYGDCGMDVVEHGWEHGPMALPVRHLGPDTPRDRCER